MKRSLARSSEAIEFARGQRGAANEFTQTVWQWIRNRQIRRQKFRREYPLTHHGQVPEKLAMWAQIDQVYMEFWAYFLGKLKSVKEGQGTLLDHTMAAWATSNGEGGHGRDKLPLILCGGVGLGIKHQGHLIKKDVLIGNVWQTVVDRIGMPLPKNFQGGQANGVTSELL